MRADSTACPPETEDDLNVHLLLFLSRCRRCARACRHFQRGLPLETGLASLSRSRFEPLKKGWEPLSGLVLDMRVDTAFLEGGGTTALARARAASREGHAHARRQGRALVLESSAWLRGKNF